MGKIVKIQKSVGGVVFSIEDGDIKFLLIKVTSKNGREKEWWEFPKGIVEPGEKEIDALKREIREETNLTDIEVIKKLGEVKYWFRDYETKELVRKTVKYYLVRKISGEVKISWEHTDFKWVSFDEALNLLTYDTHKEVLRKAYEEINKYVKRKREGKKTIIKSDEMKSLQEFF